MLLHHKCIFLPVDPCLIPKHVKMYFSLYVLSLSAQKERCATLCICKPGISAISAACYHQLRLRVVLGSIKGAEGDQTSGSNLLAPNVGDVIWAIFLRQATNNGASQQSYFLPMCNGNRQHSDLLPDFAYCPKFICALTVECVLVSTFGFKDRFLYGIKVFIMH